MKGENRRGSSAGSERWPSWSPRPGRARVAARRSPAPSASQDPATKRVPEIARVKGQGRLLLLWLSSPVPASVPPLTPHHLPAHVGTKGASDGRGGWVGATSPQRGQDRPEARPGPSQGQGRRPASSPRPAGPRPRLLPQAGVTDGPGRKGHCLWSGGCVLELGGLGGAPSERALGPRSPSGVWEPGPRQHPGLVLVTKDGKVQVTCNCLAGQPASPRGRPAGRGLFQASVSPASRHRAGGLVAGLRSPVGRRGREEGVSGPGFRARLAK